MATGKRLSSEVVLYRNGEADPYFVRYTYAFEGLPTNLTPGEIANAARNADNTSTSTPLPGDTDPPEGVPGLPQTRVSVRRYSQRTGEARIMVEWGVRYSSGGSVPAISTRSSSVVATSYQLRYARWAATAEVSQLEIHTTSISRVRTRVSFRKLITADNPTAIDLAIENNIGKLFLFGGLVRILVGGGYQPLTTTQGYVSTVFDRMAPVDAIPSGGIYTDNVGYSSLPVAALEANQEYGEPSNNGTPAKSLTESYGVMGDLNDLFWLVG